jgi:hypothetical protein
MDTAALLAASSHLPTIGQPITLIGYAVMAIAQCQCSPGDPITVMIDHQMQTTRSVCPRCQNIYSVKAMRMNDVERLSFAFVMESPAKA